MNEAWAKLLFTYGPFALLVLLVFVIERKAWTELRDQSHDRTTAYFVYGGTWLAIFVTCVVIVWVWIRLNIPAEEFTIRGRLVGLGVSEQLFSRSEDTYLRRAYSGTASSDFVFRIISSTKLGESDSVELVIDHGDNTASVFDLTIQPKFYIGGYEVRLAYDRHQDRLSLQEHSGQTVLQRLESNNRIPTRSGAPRPAAFASSLAQTVEAQNLHNISFDDFAAGLDSPDPIIRIDARQSVMKLGRGAWPYLEAVLYDPGSSTRQLVGALNVLNSGADFATDVGKQAQCNIQDIASTSDPVLRAEAEKFLASHPKTPDPDVCKPVRGRAFDCVGARLVEFDTGGLRRFTIGKQRVFVWQRSLSADDPNWAAVYVFEDESLISPERRSMKKNEFEALEPRLQKIETGTNKKGRDKSPAVVGVALQPESYAAFIVRNGDTMEVKVSGGSTLALFVRDTHYMRDMSNFQACVR